MYLTFSVERCIISLLVNIAADYQSEAGRNGYCNSCFCQGLVERRAFYYL
nr:MAG TPA: Polyubiquitin-C [Bacteriophage sp.]